MSFRSKMDGYDLAILIRLNRWGNCERGLSLTRLYSEVVSEIGWLKRGEEELLERVRKLESFGLVNVEEADIPIYGSSDMVKVHYTRITDRAREEFNLV